MNSEDEKYMRRCFELALLGRGYNSPNPKVGAVVVCENKIVGEGYHRQYGKAHAEVNAIADVKDKSLLSRSTIYVNLEPCCHYGKTPPCADLLVKSGIERCVIANRDSNPKVDGGGIRILQNAGIEVTSGVLEEEGRFLNRRFFCNQEKKRPFVILKYAQTIDGYLDKLPEDKGTEDNWISNDALKLWVHRQRSEEDSILVGYNTVLNDDPKLTTRHFKGKNPLRVVLDRDLSLSKNHNIFDNSAKTIVFNYLEDKTEENLQYIKLEKNDKCSQLEQILKKLLEHNIGSLIVEGGAKTLQRFLDENLWDEAFVIVGNKRFYRGIKSPTIATKFKQSTRMVADNGVDHYINPQSAGLMS